MGGDRYTIPAGTPGVPRRWWNIGVHIEADVAVTAEGCELLTAGLPRTPAEIERVINASSHSEPTGVATGV